MARRPRPTLANDPDGLDMIRRRLAGYLSSGRRHPEAIALLEKAVKEAKARPDRRVYLQALRDLHTHLARYVTVNTQADARSGVRGLQPDPARRPGTTATPRGSRGRRLAYNFLVVFDVAWTGAEIYRGTISQSPAGRRHATAGGRVRVGALLDVEGRIWLAQAI